jgi:hypothetical protein
MSTGEIVREPVRVGVCRIWAHVGVKSHMGTLTCMGERLARVYLSSSPISSAFMFARGVVRIQVLVHHNERASMTHACICVVQTSAPLLACKVPGRCRRARNEAVSRILRGRRTMGGWVSRCPVAILSTLRQAPAAGGVRRPTSAAKQRSAHSARLLRLLGCSRHTLQDCWTSGKPIDSVGTALTSRLPKPHQPG